MKYLTTFSFVFLLLLIFSISLYAQAPDTMWTKTFGGTDWDIAYSVQQTSDGGYIITGWTKSFGAGSLDVYLIKTDSIGNHMWDKTFGGTKDDLAYSVQQTTDDGYIITGWTESYGAGNNDVWLIKTDSAGNHMWDKSFGGTDYDAGYSVQQTTDGGYIISGETHFYGTNSCDVWLIKTDSEGNQIWGNIFGGSESDAGYSVQQSDDGGYIISGETESYNQGYSDVFLVKTDSEGNSLWEKSFGGDNFDYSRSVQQTIDRGYILTGQTLAASSYDMWLIKTDSMGNYLWDKTFGGSTWDEGFSVKQTSDGGFIITGYTDSYGPGGSNVWLIKTDSIGNYMWDRIFGGTSGDRGFSIQITDDSGYIIAGWTSSYGAGLHDVYLIKTEPDVGVKEIESRSVKRGERKLICHPNPFTDRLEIRFGMYDVGSKTYDNSIQIYDVSGRLVKNLVLSSDHSALVKTVTWDGRNDKGNPVEAGIYFLKTKDKFVRKVVKVK